MIHEIRVLDKDFAEIASGKKTFLLCDVEGRGIQEGDLLALNECVNTYTPKGAVDTGRSMLVYVDHIQPSAWDVLKSGYVIMSLKPCVVCYVKSPRDPMKMIGNDYSVQVLERGEWEKQ